MKFLLWAACAALCAAPCHADASTRPDSHAPIGVMGDHFHHKGEFMFSYRFMHMSMRGSRDGTGGVSPEAIVTREPNRFANPPMQPPTLRVVPTDMTMDMHMFGVMWAPSDKVTLMGMANYVEKEMDHVTFMGPVGANRLGEFTTKSRGLGDTTVSALINLHEGEHHRWHVMGGVSLPTGDVDATDTILTPMNTRPTVRLPYPMQLGSGSYDWLTGLTYSGNGDRWGWGAQWRSTWRTSDNDDGYRLGDEHRLTGWLSYRFNSRLSASGRVEYYDRGNIAGQDPRIVAPVQTADPDRQGIERVDAGVGLNLLLPGDKHRIALELGAPIQEDLDGPQLETDWHLTLGWQLAM